MRNSLSGQNTQNKWRILITILYTNESDNVQLLWGFGQTVDLDPICTTTDWWGYSCHNLTSGYEKKKKQKNKLGLTCKAQGKLQGVN